MVYLSILIHAFTRRKATDVPYIGILSLAYVFFIDA